MGTAADLADKKRAKCNGVAKVSTPEERGKDDEPTQITTAVATIFH
jgi:hypothetical protein